MLRRMDTLMHAPFLALLAQRYVWWKTPEEAWRFPAHALAHIMDRATFDETQQLLKLVKEETLVETLRSALAGWFSPKSWHYWHYRLRLCAVECVPPLPVRVYE